MAARPQPSARWARGRPQQTILAPGEFLTSLKILTPDGHWLVCDRALISPLYNASWILEKAVVISETPQQDLAQEEIHTFLTPLGTVTSRRSVVLWFELEQLPLPPTLMRLPVLERAAVGNLEVDMILGYPFYKWFCQNQRQAQLNVQEPGILNADSRPLWPEYEEEELLQGHGGHRIAGNQAMDPNY
ncbi:hypothetical protein QBC43DRAFT_293405 [Cladorrhinum sp. PSN259]|nr:hypothetical protein QBC43DRAFT_293405 [Cladorrhinum sp. PSN259]